MGHLKKTVPIPADELNSAFLWTTLVPESQAEALSDLPVDATVHLLERARAGQRLGGRRQQESWIHSRRPRRDFDPTNDGVV